MRIGIYGSSFNPITNGHLWSANTIAVREELNKVIFLPSSSKRHDKHIETEDRHRMEMLKLAIQGNPRFELDDYEMKAIAGKHTTYFTMQHFKKVYPEDELFFVLGADILGELPTWTFASELIKTTKFIVIERGNLIMHRIIAEHPILRKYERNFTLIYKGLVNEISSSYIREEFENGGDPRYLLPDSVWQYIIKNNMYQGENCHE